MQKSVKMCLYTPMMFVCYNYVTQKFKRGRLFLRLMMGKSVFWHHIQIKTMPKIHSTRLNVRCIKRIVLLIYVQNNLRSLSHDLFSVMEQFSTPESCIEHLQKVRWGDTPKCPHCDSDRVAPKRETDKTGRWNCHFCKSSFNVLSGTMFQGTKIPLPKWFAGIALMVNAKKSLSSCQLARHLGMNQMFAWSCKRFGLKWKGKGKHY